MKTCNTCHVEKPEEDYYDRRLKCKTCCLEMMARYRKGNRDAINSQQQRWRERNKGHSYVDKKSGYTMYIDVDHPATGPHGVTRLHRVVLYDTLVEQGADLDAIPCNWCGSVLPWNKIKADHLSWDRSDNRPENLVPSCFRCNVKRRRPAPMTRCTVENCKRKAKAKGLCHTHYKQNWLGQEMRDVQYRPNKATREAIVFDVQAGMTIKGVGKKHNLDFSSISRIYKRETGHTIRDWRLAQKSRRN